MHADWRGQTMHPHVSDSQCDQGRSDALDIQEDGAGTLHHRADRSTIGGDHSGISVPAANDATSQPPGHLPIREELRSVLRDAALKP